LSAAVYGCCGLHPHYLVSLGGRGLLSLELMCDRLSPFCT
jgi:hypothetical protein